ncbi:hypothetical protein [Demequina pelophila]|uniref:hypothetical protein n=1 Tax=Demequina pelophila TaxID=1638984 RepID=UPI0007850FC6|nr:hypothetical protein [Demequina pelophila]
MRKTTAAFALGTTAALTTGLAAPALALDDTPDLNGTIANVLEKATCGSDLELDITWGFEPRHTTADNGTPMDVVLHFQATGQSVFTIHDQDRDLRGYHATIPASYLPDGPYDYTLSVTFDGKTVDPAHTGSVDCPVPDPVVEVPVEDPDTVVKSGESPAVEQYDTDPGPTVVGGSTDDQPVETTVTGVADTLTGTSPATGLYDTDPGHTIQGGSTDDQPIETTVTGVADTLTGTNPATGLYDTDPGETIQGGSTADQPVDTTVTGVADTVAGYSPSGAQSDAQAPVPYQWPDATPPTPPALADDAAPDLIPPTTQETPQLVPQKADVIVVTGQSTTAGGNSPVPAPVAVPGQTYAGGIAQQVPDQPASAAPSRSPLAVPATTQAEPALQPAAAQTPALAAATEPAAPTAATAATPALLDAVATPTTDVPTAQDETASEPSTTSESPTTATTSASAVERSTLSSTGASDQLYVLAGGAALMMLAGTATVGLARRRRD